MTRAEKAARIGKVLAELYPLPPIPLRHEDPYTLLVAVVLSAQCTDARVNLVTPELFRRFPGARDLAGARPADVEELIQSCGLFRAKAKALIGASRAILEEHGGRVPRSREALSTLPGVGNKTAGVVSMHLGGDPAFPVDTHVARLAYRLGFTRQADPDKIEADLRALFPEALWMPGHHALIFHGRSICLARAPDCPRCPVADLCPKRGVRRPR
jgi:endonuclease-3